MTFSTRLRDLLWRFKHSRKAQLGVSIGILVVLGIGIGSSIAIQQSWKSKSVTLTNNTNSVTDVTDIQRRRLLDGVFVDSEEAMFAMPIAVMVENLSTIRPQKGLGSASVVYEALAEGGITRFMAIFAGPGEISEIGPVRSAREYYVDWAEEYGGLYAHVGGSPDALARLAQQTEIVDLNQIGGDQLYFWRDTDISAPHNLLTSSEKLAYAVRDTVGETTRADFEPWLFKEDAKKANRPEGEHTITLHFSSYSYEVEWAYDKKTNSYTRSNGGEEQVDALTDKPLRANTIVVQLVETSLLDDETGRLDLATQGEGIAAVFVDGERIDGTWKKPTEDARTRFYDDTGAEIELNAGPIWVEVLPSDKEIIST